MAKKASKKTITLNDLDRKLDRVIEIMATKDDVKRLDARIDKVIDTMATKDDLFALEVKFERKIDALDEKYSKKFQELLLMMEGLMKPISELKMEYTGMMIQLSRHEEWIKLIAEKSGIKLPM